MPPSWRPVRRPQPPMKTGSGSSSTPKRARTSARTASLAARALGSIGYRPATPYLIERLLDASPEMRVAAADGLGLMGDDAGFDPLRARLGDTAETDDVKVHAAWALALLSPGDRYLLQRLRDKSYHEPTLLELLDSVRAIRR